MTESPEPTGKPERATLWCGVRIHYAHRKKPISPAKAISRPGIRDSGIMDPFTGIALRRTRRPHNNIPHELAGWHHHLHPLVVGR
jgi:hypothetical protein